MSISRYIGFITFRFMMMKSVVFDTLNLEYRFGEIKTEISVQPSFSMVMT